MPYLPSIEFTNATSKTPLHFLAQVATNNVENSPCIATLTVEHSRSAGPSFMSSSSPPFIIASSPSQTVASLHISCGQPSLVPDSSPRPLRRSSTSNSLRTTRSTSSTSSVSAKARKNNTRKASRSSMKVKTEMKARREDLMERALKIRSLDNSPVNDRQLIVLRMVYDEITMYPSESWMVLIAIIIHRAFKQVKNWFSNERQKHKAGETVSVHTTTGEKLRLRPSALKFCRDWSDSFFEEVVMIHNYKTLRRLRWEEAQKARTTTSSQNQ